MLRKSFHLILAVTLAVGLAAAQKKAPKSETQPRGSLVETQGTPGQDSRDEVMLYRFQLAAADAGFRLVVSNPSDVEGEFRLAGKVHSVAPGETVVLDARDTDWLSPEGVAVKAPRRLHLSLRSADSDERITLKQSPKTSVYEIFSAERAPASARGRREELGTRRKGSLVLYHAK